MVYAEHPFELNLPAKSLSVDCSAVVYAEHASALDLSMTQHRLQEQHKIAPLPRNLPLFAIHRQVVCKETELKSPQLVDVEELSTWRLSEFLEPCPEGSELLKSSPDMRGLTSLGQVRSVEAIHCDE